MDKDQLSCSPKECRGPISFSTGFLLPGELGIKRLTAVEEEYEMTTCIRLCLFSSVGLVLSSLSHPDQHRKWRCLPGTWALG